MQAMTNRRTILKGAGKSVGVLAIGPLLNGILGEAAKASPSEKNATRRFDFDTPYNRIGTGSFKWDAAVRDDHMSRIVAGMGIADMDFECAPVVTEAIRRRTSHRNWGYETLDVDLLVGNAGKSPFFKSIINWNRERYGIRSITPENLGIITGVHAGIMLGLRAFAPPGSKVLMTTPIYNAFYYDLFGSRAAPNECQMKIVNGRYEIDWEHFEYLASQPETKSTILCNPHNPTGRVWTKDELHRYGEICLKHKVKVLADEIHCDFVGKGMKYTPFSTLDDKDIVANSVTFKAASKSFSLAGMKCAWFFATDPEVFKTVQFYNRTEVSTFGTLTSQAAYEGGESWLNQCVEYIDGNQRYANDYIKANIPLLKALNKPEGTYLAWVDVSGLAAKIDAERLAAEANKKPHTPSPLAVLIGGSDSVRPDDVVERWLVDNAFVQMNVGYSYGAGGSNYMRMNVATSRKTLTAALDSIAAATKKLA